MSLLDEFAATDMGKSMALPKLVEKPPAPRDFDAEHRRDAVHAFGSHVLDGLPIAPVMSAESRKAQAAAEAELEKTKAEAAEAAGEALAGQAKLLELEQAITAKEASLRRDAMKQAKEEIVADRKARGKRELTPSELTIRAHRRVAKGGK